jgi:adenylosuccinate synthase
MRTAKLIIDLQFGSTGKGLIAGYLAKRQPFDTIVTAWSPNAGHTFIDSDGRKFIHTTIPNGIVGTHVKRVMLGAGSVINLDNFTKEWKECQDILEGKINVFIHENATVVSPYHMAEEEKTMVSIGSTRKGVGAALIEKIRRNPDSKITARQFINRKEFDLPGVAVVTSKVWDEIMADDVENVLIEGCQGYSLSIHHGFYPYTTSRDVSTHQILADCCIPRIRHHNALQVIGCCRTYPIRVANRYNDKGEMIGWSGGCYEDQGEINFGDIGQEVEYTTVTRLPRRIFTFSKEQVSRAIELNGVDDVFLNFTNYCYDKELNNIKEFISSKAFLRYYSNGPSETNVTDVLEMGS